MCEHLDGEGPDVSERQFGFRASCSAVYAIAELRGQVRRATEERGTVVAMSLNIANAFYSFPFAISEEARKFDLPLYLRQGGVQ